MRTMRVAYVRLYVCCTFLMHWRYYHRAIAPSPIVVVAREWKIYRKIWFEWCEIIIIIKSSKWTEAELLCGWCRANVDWLNWIVSSHHSTVKRWCEPTKRRRNRTDQFTHNWSLKMIRAEVAPTRWWAHMHVDAIPKTASPSVQWLERDDWSWSIAYLWAIALHTDIGRSQ